MSDPDERPVDDDAPSGADGVAPHPDAELDAELDTKLDTELDVDGIVEEEELARRRLSAIEAGRRKGGAAGAAMAGAMLAVSEIYEGPKRDEIVAVSETPDEPTDIDEDGIRVDVDDVTVESHPPGR